MTYILLLVFILLAFPATAADVRSTVSGDGKEIITLLERNDEDGGIVTATCAPVGDGTFYCTRSWEGRGIRADDATRDPAEVEAEKLAAQEAAISAAEALTDKDIEVRAAKAIEQGTIGSAEAVPVEKD